MDSMTLTDADINRLTSVLASRQDLKEIPINMKSLEEVIENLTTTISCI